MTACADGLFPGLIRHGTLFEEKLVFRVKSDPPGTPLPAGGTLSLQEGYYVGIMRKKW